MRYCNHCKKALPNGHQWCPYCMQRLQPAKPFKNTPLKSNIIRARAIQIVPYSLIAIAAIGLVSALIGRAMLSPPSVIAENTQPSGDSQPFESEISSDYTETSETARSWVDSPTAELPSAVSGSSAEDHVLREVDIDFFTQELIDYLHQQYPNHLYPTKKHSGMESCTGIEAHPSTTPLYEETYSYYLGSAAFCIMTSIMSAEPELGQYVIDDAFRNNYNYVPGSDITDSFPEESTPVDTRIDFTIEYAGISPNGSHSFDVYYHISRPVYKHENFDSEQWLDKVKQIMPPQYTWVDSFNAQEFSYSVYCSYIVQSSPDTIAAAQEVVALLTNLIPASDTRKYYDVYIGRAIAPSTQPNNVNKLELILCFFEEKV